MLYCTVQYSIVYSTVVYSTVYSVMNSVQYSILERIYFSILIALQGEPTPKEKFVLFIMLSGLVALSGFKANELRTFFPNIRSCGSRTAALCTTAAHSCTAAAQYSTAAAQYSTAAAQYSTAAAKYSTEVHLCLCTAAA
jgi:hypothetical protein